MKHARKYNCGSFFIFMLPSPKFLWKVIILLSMIIEWKGIVLLSTWKGLKVFKYAFILPHLNLKKIVMFFLVLSCLPSTIDFIEGYWIPSMIVSVHRHNHGRNSIYSHSSGRILNINLAQLKVLIFAIIHPQFQ